MPENSSPSLQIDLNEFKLRLCFKNRSPLTLHFNTPSRKFYLSLIALVLFEMKKAGKIKTIPMKDHFDLLVLLNETIGGGAGSSMQANLFHRLYTKWKDALPNLEEAPLFKVLGRKKEGGEGALGKVYELTEAEKDGWANLFEYVGSEENVRLKFALDRIGIGLDEAHIIWGEYLDQKAWEQFIAGWKKGKAEKPESVTEGPTREGLPDVETPAVPIPTLQEEKSTWFPRYRWLILILAIGLAAAGAVWKFYLRPGPLPVAALERMKYPLPDKPSIAVLPFVNLSEDPKQEYFSDGITEDLITGLSKISGLMVIARNSTVTYKGKAVTIKQVAEDLGVRYVLEGSVRRDGHEIRINAQLIDALTGHHLWAERYDRELKDIFALQDEMVLKILNSVGAKLTGFDPARLEKFAEKYFKGKQGLDCYLKLMQAGSYMERYSIENNNLARTLAEEVIALCPGNPWGYSTLSGIYLFDYRLGNTQSPRECLETGIALAQKAVALDDHFPTAHAMLSALHRSKGDYDKAIAEGERGVAISSNWLTLTSYGASLTVAGRPKEAIPLFQEAIRLNPIGPAYLYLNLGEALRLTGRYEEAVSAYKKGFQLNTGMSEKTHLGLIVTYIMMGREKEARFETELILKKYPNFSLDEMKKSRIKYKDQSENEKYYAALRQAGLK